jgi:tripartite-type tricarboxylate transporter receptor subunit TctC
MVIDAYPPLAGAMGAGAIKALAIGATRRLPEFDGLATAAETLPGYNARGWLALVAPLGTPEAIVRKVSDDLRTVVTEADTKAKLAALGNYMDPMSPADVMAFVRAEQQMWKPVLEQIARNP